jgi:glycosyltransferase involved in cell wall biosynthesis
MHVAFLQPFGISSPGGGSRILRALLQNSPVRWTSICTAPESPPKAAFGNEIHLPIRPGFGKLDRSRLRFISDWLEPKLGDRFQKRLESECRRLGITAIHSIPHGLDFVHGYQVSRRLGAEFFFNLHDDLQDTIGTHPAGRAALESVAEIWRGANARFVISDQIGREYCSRYGQQEFEVITDGIERLSGPRQRAPNQLHVYFMGLFHIRYERNLTGLFRAMDIVRTQHPKIEIKATFRCGNMRETALAGAKGIRVLPFGTESDVESDLADADLLYLPLPFTAEDACFVRYSLSTKMITYLGSGIPILYHGPRQAAACEVLSENNAAFVCDTLSREAIAAVLREVIINPAAAATKVEHSLDLARQRFMLKNQRDRFWSTITGRRRQLSRLLLTTESHELVASLQ